MRMEMLKKMHAKFGFYEDVVVDHDWMALRIRMIAEELEELMSAKTPEDMVDALIDLSVFALGTLDLAGVDFDKAWTQVMTANLKKSRGTKATRPGSKGFDLVKDADWVEPDHSGNTGAFKPRCEAHHLMACGICWE